VATGDVIAGYTGTEQRATYTCVGDTVNLAARLEAMTKELAAPILLDGATRAAASATAFEFESLGAHRVRGRLGEIELLASKDSNRCGAARSRGSQLEAELRRSIRRVEVSSIRNRSFDGSRDG
jgi:class 3 adenylate cyclase